MDQSVVVLEKDRALKDTSNELLSVLGFPARGKDYTPNESVAPGPVVIVGDPYIQPELTKGVDFCAEPDLAIENISSVVRESHGNTSGLIIHTAILPDELRMNKVRARTRQVDQLINGVPVVEKGIDLTAVTNRLNEIHDVRRGYVSHFSHQVFNAFTAVGLELKLAQTDIDASNYDVALSRVPEFNNTLNKVLRVLQDFNPKYQKAAFSQGHSGLNFTAVFPRNPDTLPMGDDKNIDPRFILRQTGAEVIIADLEERIESTFIEIESLRDSAIIEEVLQTSKARISDSYDRLKHIRALWV